MENILDLIKSAYQKIESVLIKVYLIAFKIVFLALLLFSCYFIFLIITSKESEISALSALGSFLGGVSALFALSFAFYEYLKYKRNSVTRTKRMQLYTVDLPLFIESYELMIAHIISSGSSETERFRRDVMSYWTELAKQRAKILTELEGVSFTDERYSKILLEGKTVITHCELEVNLLSNNVGNISRVNVGKNESLLYELFKKTGLVKVNIEKLNRLFEIQHDFYKLKKAGLSNFDEYNKCCLKITSESLKALNNLKSDLRDS